MVLRRQVPRPRSDWADRWAGVVARGLTAGVLRG